MSELMSFLGFSHWSLIALIVFFIFMFILYKLLKRNLKLYFKDHYELISWSLIGKIGPGFSTKAIMNLEQIINQIRFAQELEEIKKCYPVLQDKKNHSHKFKNSLKNILK